jgi:putative ABC transport system substrate-binding protein
MTSWRPFVVALGLGLLWAPLAFPGEHTKTVPRIGYLGLGSVTGNPESLAGLRQGLRDLGYVEGQDIRIEYR